MRFTPFSLSAALVLSATAAAAPAGPRFVTARHAYARGEQAVLQVQCDPAAVDAIAFDTGGWLEQTAPLRAGGASYHLDTALLHAGDYAVRAQPLHGAARVGQPVVFELSIAAARNPQRFPVWDWAEGESPDLGWWVARGFNGFRLSTLQDPTRDPADMAAWLAIYDNAERLGVDMGAYFYPLLSTHWLGPDQAQSRVLMADGTRDPKKPYPLDPAVLGYARRTAAYGTAQLADYPAWTHVLMDSEFEVPFVFNDTAIEACRRDTGLDMKALLNPKWTYNNYALIKPELLPAELQPKNGIIADDNAMYRFLQWWWQKGHGTATLNAAMAQVVKSRRPDVVTWHDPYRLAPVHGSHAGLDMISTWTDGAAWPGRLAYTSVLQAAARPDHQKVMQTITLFLYAYSCRPLTASTADRAHDRSGQDPYYTDGPDYARETTWLVMSQRPDVLGFYSAGALSPDIPTLDPSVNSPETFDAIGQTSRSLIEPYGPTILQTRRVHPRVAVLLSAASSWFSNGATVNGYVNERVLPYEWLLMMNHVPFDVLLDDDISAGRLADYDVLVMPRAETLTQSMYRNIVRFAASGKKVIADKSLRADIPGAAVTNFDFGFIAALNGTNLARGTATTADELRSRMEAYADALKPLLAGTETPAGSDSKRVFLNSLQSGDVRYVFAINDERTYGPRFGQYKLMQELGVARTANLDLAAAPKAALYDALARAPIEAPDRNGRRQFQVDLPAAQGRLIAVLPEAIGKVELELPAQAERGHVFTLRARVLGVSGAAIDGSLPLRIQITDPLGRDSEYNRYVATTAGPRGYEYSLDLHPALNDSPGTWTVKVTDLLSGAQALGSYTL